MPVPVLEREEDESFRGARTLTRDYHAGHAHAAAVAQVGKIGGAHHALQREIAAPGRRHTEAPRH